MKRLFIGIPIQSPEVFRTTECWKTDEQLNHYVLKWVNPANWHITLVFLGDTPESEVAVLEQLIKEAFAGISSFSAELSGPGVFPNTNNPKVLWLGLSSLQPLMSAHFRLIELIQQKGFSLDNKPLKPHLTLARIRNPKHFTSFESMLKHDQQSTFGTVKIHSVVLYESILTPGGPDYKPLFVMQLI